MKYLGIDWGLKKVGLAVSEGELSTPWQSITVKSLADGVAKVKSLADQIEAEELIIGLPEGGSGKLVRKVVKELSGMGLHVISADETLSTKTAKEEMINLGFSKKLRRDDNSMAAAIILQRYLDEKP